jgi:hypothetical protein
MNKEYNLAVALMQFKQAYKLLTTASKALPDLDMSEGYPFYLLDFEDITEAVCAWCSIHAAKLLRELPDKVDNPACTKCEHFRIGFGSDGLCKAAAIKNCNLYPQIIFSREQVAPFMAERGEPVTPQQSDVEIYLKYLHVLEVLYDRKDGDKKEDSQDLQQIKNQHDSAVNNSPGIMLDQD